MSKAEVRLWTQIRNGRLGFKFRRQHPFGPYTLDFFSPEAKLCIEVDGQQHEREAEYDGRRDAYLAERGILTYRVAANSVFVVTGSVSRHILDRREKRTGRKGIDGFEWFRENVDPPPASPFWSHEPSTAMGKEALPPCPPPPAHVPSPQGEEVGQ